MSAPSSSSSGRLASWLPAVAAATAAAAVGYAMYRSVRAAELAFEEKEAPAARASAAPASASSARAAAAAPAAAAARQARPSADVPPKDDEQQQPQAKKSGGPSLPPRPASAGRGGSSSNKPAPSAAAAAPASNDGSSKDVAEKQQGEEEAPASSSNGDVAPSKKQQHERGSACDACGKEAGGDKSGGSGSGGSKKPLQRCSRCRDAFYCGPACQRSHAPEHRAECDRKAALLEEAKAKIEAAEGGNGAAAPSAPAPVPAAAADNNEEQKEQEEQPRAPAPDADADADNDANSNNRSDAQTVMEALAAHLEGRHRNGEEAGSQAPPPPSLPRLYERAVVAFVRGEYASAIEQMKGVRALAEKEGDRAVAGDALRWTGHAHNRLGDPTSATRAFVEGVEIAREAIKAEEQAAEGGKDKKEEDKKQEEEGGDGATAPPTARPKKLTREQRLARLRKLEIDCLSGLGVMARGQGRPTEAVTHLQAALEAADALGDRDTRAGVLANLGAARLPLDRARATSELAESVALRERRVVELHAAGERQGLATAILEHAGSLVSLAGALYAGRRHREAAGAYERALDVFEAIGDGDKALGALANLANLHELQMADRDAAELEAHARAAAAARRRRGSGDGGEGDEEEEGVVVAGAARRRAAAFRRRLHGLAKEVLPERGEQEAECALCDEALEEGGEDEGADNNKGAADEGGKAPAASSPRRRRRRIIVLGCLHSHHEPCWRAWCERPGQPECPRCAKEAAEAMQRRQEMQQQAQAQQQ